MKKVLFLGFDGKYGLTYHFVDWIIAFDKAANERLEITFLTVNHEQHTGLHQKLKNLQYTDVIKVNDLDDLEKLDCLPDVDIVHCHGFRQAAKMFKIRKADNLKYKMVITMHSFRHGCWYRPFYANFVSFLYVNKTDVVHFLSHTSKDEFLQYNFCYKRSNGSFVFPLGCNKDEFLEDQSIEHLDFYRELVKGEKNIAYLAGFSPRKQHLWLLKAVGNVLIRENAKLWLFGEGTDKEKAIRYVKDNNLSNRVRFPGKVDRKHIPAILKQMDLAVCTSKSENSPHAIMEPMFAGIPVVTFDVGTASYLIRDFTNGFVVDGKSEGRNFQKAVQFLLRNKACAVAMGQRNRSFAHQWLTWQVLSENSISMYLSM